MKLIIFGVTGGTGRQLLDQALAQGHEVTAFARNPGKIEQNHENLRIVAGDVLDGAVVENAIKGHDAVLCALGAPAMNRKMIRAKGTEVIVQAMEKTGVKRLVSQSGIGCDDSWSLLPFRHRYLVFPLFLRYVYADHEQQEKVIKQSNLDWILVRPAALTNGKLTQEYWAGVGSPDKPLSIKISRADVADFMLKQLTDDANLHKAPSLSYYRRQRCASHGRKARCAS